MHQAKRVAKNTGILYGRMLVTIFISLYTTRLVLSALGASDFGLFNLVAGAISMLGFLNNSMTAATQRFISYAQGEGDPEKIKKIFNVSLLLHIVIAAAVLVLLEAAGLFFFGGYLKISPDRLFAAKIVYQCMVVSTLFTVISVPYDAVINARENMLLFAILSIAEAVLKLLIAIFIVHSATDHLILYGSLMALVSVLLLTARRVYCTRKYPECSINIRKYYEGGLMKSMSSFAGWSLLGAATSMITFYGQGIVLNVFFGTLINAAQSIASQVSGQLGVLATNMLKALNPIITKSAGADDKDTMIKMSILGSKISFFLLMIVYVPMLLEMPYILSIWLKNVPDNTVIFCRLILIRNLLEVMFLTLSSSISAVGKIKNFQIYSSLITILPLPITYILFKLDFPPSTLYVIFILYTVLFAINILIFSKKSFNLSAMYFLKSAVFYSILIFCIEIALSGIPLLFMHEGTGRLISVLAINGVSFLLLVWGLGLAASERAKIKEMFVGRFNKLKFLSKPLSPISK